MHPLRWSVCLIVFAVALALATSFTAEGRPRYLRNLVAAYPKVKDSRLEACTTCHVTAPAVGALPEGATTPELNPYGKALNGAKVNFTAIESLDSDRDGASNRKELDALSFPGDSLDRPGKPRPAPRDSSAKPDSTAAPKSTGDARQP